MRITYKSMFPSLENSEFQDLKVQSKQQRENTIWAQKSTTTGLITQVEIKHEKDKNKLNVPISTQKV